jgi:hypothetical protein
MATGRVGVPLDRLRELLRTRVEAGSIRGVAGEIGMPPNGLSYFLEGGAPREATLRKLEAWFLAEATRRLTECRKLEGWFLQAVDRAAPEPSEEAAEVAVSILTRGLPRSLQKGARARIIALVEELCEEAGVTRPSWLSPGNATATPPP